MIARTLLLRCSTGGLMVAADLPAPPWKLDAGKITKQALDNLMRNQAGDTDRFIPPLPAGRTPLMMTMEPSDKVTLAANRDGRCAVPLLQVPIKDASRFSMQRLETGDGKFDAMAVKPMPICSLP